MFYGAVLSGLSRCKLLFTVFIITIAMMLGSQNAFANSKYAAFIYDANKGKVLFARNADAYRYPASLTKMMTLYMVFDAIDAGKISLSTRMRVSARATRAVPSKLYLKKGSSIRVKDAILALVTKSANDVAIVIAEHLGGTESNFARMMTRKARSIGMTRTTFANASGLPNRKQRTTARDMARLGLSLRQSHPKSFRYFATRSFKYKGKTYRNHNRLLGRVGGVNGIKTGYIRASGFNLVTNVEKNGRHVVGVVMGGKSGRSRNAHMATLIKRHLKKASRKNRRNKVSPLLVSKSSKSKTVFASNAPLPTLRPQTKSPVVVATNLRTNKPAEQGLSEAKVIKTATNQTAEPSKKVGWKIQLSATPDLSEAKELLEEASLKGASVLSKKTPYTESVTKGSSTFYRVRFAGFRDKNTARRACKFMKTKKYNCIYLN
ncbi:MAG: D-alanyl-D-alanine carboxypeptidase [Hyphomicrobiales bacterium]